MMQMKPHRVAVLFLLPSIGAGQVPAVSPSKAVVNQGQSIQFTADRPVIWSLAPGSRGSIDANGLYQAPADVIAKQQAGGCQLLPNDHIFNTRIDSLPVHPQSGEWLGRIRTGNPSAKVNYYHSQPLNVVDNDVPMREHRFRYTPQSNGVYWNPPLPDVKYQSGAYLPDNSGIDSHLISVNRATCDFQELYNVYKTSPPCANCTAASGTKYNAAQYDLLTAGTDAAATPIYPGVLRMDEIERSLATGEPIRHVLRVTLANRFIKAARVWPARANAVSPSGNIPYGTRFRLRADFSTNSTNPVTQLLVRQLKEYGLILVDGGIDWMVAVDDNIQIPPLVRSAFNEFSSIASVATSNLEIVDQALLMMTDMTGAVKADNGYVTPDDYVEVIATEAANPFMRTSVRVALRGVTVGVPSGRLFIQAGSAPTQLTAWINGAEDQSVNWSMSPAIDGAELSPSGMFSPPATADAPVATTIRATSNADPRAFTEIIAVVLPHGILRIAMGASNHTDEEGNVWWAETRLSEVPQWANAIDSGHNWTSVSRSAPYRDMTLYHKSHMASQDMRAAFIVPNGTYRLTAKMTESQRCPTPCRQHIEVNGRIVYRDLTIIERAGGLDLPLDLILPAVVTDGRLTVAIRGMSPAGLHTKLSALQIERIEAVRELKIEPGVVPVLTRGKTYQFHSVGWFMNDAVRWEVVSGPGKIDENGLYTAPMSPAEATVIVRATSIEDPEKFAESGLRLVFGDMSITPERPNVFRSERQTFSAIMGGAPYESVTWTLNGRGTIDEAGIYVAPDDVASDETVTVTATSKDDPRRTASATFTITRSFFIRVNAGGQHCGSTPLTDHLGRIWENDYGWTGSTATWIENSAPIAGAQDGTEPLYRCGRYAYGQSDFSYAFDVPNGEYAVTLKWAEYRPTDQGYKFDVILNGERVLENFNFVQAAGGVRIAYDRSFTVRVTDGRLSIVFDGRPGAGYNGSAINAIEIIRVDEMANAPASRSIRGTAALKGLTKSR